MPWMTVSVNVFFLSGRLIATIAMPPRSSYNTSSAMSPPRAAVCPLPCTPYTRHFIAPEYRNATGEPRSMSNSEQSQHAPSSDSDRTSEFDVIVVGAGFAGMYLLHRLRERGLLVRVYEAG